MLPEFHNKYDYYVLWSEREQAYVNKIIYSEEGNDFSTVNIQNVVWTTDPVSAQRFCNVNAKLWLKAFKGSEYKMKAYKASMKIDITSEEL